MTVLNYIESESVRQSATLDETLNMVDAWRYVAKFEKIPNLATVTHIHWLITHQARPGYRKVPAVFNQGMPAIAADLIPNAMERWHGYMTSVGLECGSSISVDILIKEFLAIHPFVDGNGRVASLLWNYLRGSIMDPYPLPNYEFM